MSGDLAWSGDVTLATGETLRPLHDAVFIKRDKPSETIGMIIIPDKAKRDQQHGTVIAVGPGKRDPKTGKRKPMDVKVGDRVMFDGHAARHFRKDADEVYVVESEVLVKIVEDDEAGT